MNITFPDGSVKQYEDGMTALQIAESISPPQESYTCRRDRRQQGGRLPPHFRRPQH